MDGVLIATSYLSGMRIGVSTTLAIILHEIPHELGDFGILVASGLSARRAVGLNCASALVAVLGTVLGLEIGSSVYSFSTYMLPFTAGNFIYIAGTDLMPELLAREGWRAELLKLLALGLGLLVMIGLVSSPGLQTK